MSFSSSRNPLGIRATGAVLAFSFSAMLAPSAAARVFLTQEEALRLAFPTGVVVERRTSFLTPTQQGAVQKLSGADRPPSALVISYAGTREGRLVGTAYFDTHLVRTQPESLMVLVASNGTIERIEVLSFSEPEEYMPREHWYGQFPGKGLDRELSLKRGVRAVSGATLTARATIEAARRILALHRALHPDLATIR
jgi:uncharacterized protein with FMN-binding domain